METHPLSGRALGLLNQRAYSSRAAAKSYDKTPTLYETERIILEELAAEIRGKRLLDVGIGGGRTTPFLLELSADYTGIDYSPILIERAKRRFHLESLYVCDVRDMSRFANGTFDFALFSFSGLDSICHEDRLRALREIHRVLKPRSPFVFSAHNRAWSNAGKPPWRLENARWTLTFIKSCIWALLFQPRHWRLRRYEVNEKEYAIINGAGLRYSCLDYFISIPSQIAQLRKLDFEGARAYDMQGRVVAEDRNSPWIYYVARRGLG